MPSLCMASESGAALTNCGRLPTTVATFTGQRAYSAPAGPGSCAIRPRTASLRRDEVGHAGRTLEQRGDLRGRSWLADEVALRDVAPDVAGEDPLVVGLDALRHDRGSESVCELDAAGDDRLGGRVTRDACEEAVIQLHLLHRSPKQARKRRVSGSEVVDCESNTECVRTLDDLHCASLVSDQSALCELEHEVPRRKLVTLEEFGDLFRERDVEQIDSAQVHRDLEL